MIILKSLFHPLACLIMGGATMVSNARDEMKTLRDQAAGGDVKAQLDLAVRPLRGPLKWRALEPRFHHQNSVNQLVFSP